MGHLCFAVTIVVLFASQSRLHAQPLEVEFCHLGENILCTVVQDNDANDLLPEVRKIQIGSDGDPAVVALLGVRLLLSETITPDGAELSMTQLEADRVSLVGLDDGGQFRITARSSQFTPIATASAGRVVYEGGAGSSWHEAPLDIGTHTLTGNLLVGDDVQPIGSLNGPTISIPGVDPESGLPPASVSFGPYSETADVSGSFDRLEAVLSVDLLEYENYLSFSGQGVKVALVPESSAASLLMLGSVPLFFGARSRRRR